MLISPPFLLSRATNQLDPDWLNLCMPPDGEHGHYPVAYALQWHGGIHLKAPQDNGAAARLRAIADGKVIYVRQPTAFSDSPTHPLQYGNNVADHEKASGPNSVWTDDGCIVIEHITEIGAAGDTPVSVTFYSVYMHLHSIEATVQLNRMVYRKDTLGEPGRIYGGTRDRCHLEIVCDDDNLKKLIGRSSGDLPLTAHGRSDAVFGEIYFYLPADTPVYGQAPLDHSATALEQPSAAQGQPLSALTPLTAMTALSAPLIVGLRYDEGYALSNRGDLMITSYQPDGTRLDPPLNFQDADYALYERATEISNAYTQRNLPAPAPSAVYELLRFGRVLNTANETLTPNDVPHWRQIKLPDGSAGWVNLNTTSIKVFSDADCPQWKQWKIIDDGGQGADSRCDSAALRALLDVDGNGEVTPTEAASAYAAKREQMTKIIAKFPSEWDQTNLEAKWVWLKTSTAENAEALEAADFNLFKTHLQKLSFWSDVPALPKDPWHFNPIAFIQHFRMCGWLSKNELMQMVPSAALRKNNSGAYLWETVAKPEDQDVFKNHRIPLNKMMRKYGIGSTWRRACLLGNAIQETGWLSALQEGSPNNHKYSPWYGRGLLQLTWPNNYIKYWRYRGRTIPNALENSLNVAATTADNTGSNAGLQDSNFSALTEQMKGWRANVEFGTNANPKPAEDKFAPSDSAGFYWLQAKMASYADCTLDPNATHTLERKQIGTNQGSKVYYRSKAFWKASAAVNAPGKIGNESYSGINGFDSRCCAYGVSLAALSDLFFFPNAQGQLILTFPESNTRRVLE